MRVLSWEMRPFHPYSVFEISRKGGRSFWQSDHNPHLGAEILDLSLNSTLRKTLTVYLEGTTFIACITINSCKNFQSWWVGSGPIETSAQWWAKPIPRTHGLVEQGETTARTPSGKSSVFSISLLCTRVTSGCLTYEIATDLVRVPIAWFCESFIIDMQGTHMGNEDFYLVICQLT